MSRTWIALIAMSAAMPVMAQGDDQPDILLPPRVTPQVATERGTRSDIPTVPVPQLVDSQDELTPERLEAIERAKKNRAAREALEFEEALRMLVPITPEQIVTYDRLMQALKESLGKREPPTASTASIPVTTQTGVPPQTILMSDDYITTLSLLDSTGEPWPITSAQAGTGQFVDVKVPEQPGNIIVLTPLRQYAQTNLVVLLRGHHVPISLTLKNDRDAAYYSANLIMDQPGPMAVVVEEAPPATPNENKIMRAIIDGLGPTTPGVKQVEITGATNTTAFVHEGDFYLRTPLTLQFPAQTATIRSGSMRVYQLPAEPFVTVIDRSGRTIDLAVSSEIILDGALSASPTEARAASAYKPRGGLYGQY